METNRDDETGLARTFLQHVVNDLYAFGSPEFQQSVWIRGDHPKKYVQDFVEAVETFRDFSGGLISDGLWKAILLSAHQIAALERFQEKLLAFSDTLPDRDSAVAIADPRWPAITAAAKETLSVLQGEQHGIRPQIDDDAP